MEFLDREGHLLAVAGWSGVVRVMQEDATAELRSAALLNHGDPLYDLVPLGGDEQRALVATRSLACLTKFWQIPAATGAEPDGAAVDLSLTRTVSSAPLGRPTSSRPRPRLPIGRRSMSG